MGRSSLLGPMDQISIAPAYIFLFIGGFFGLHHIYLGRENHALLTVGVGPWWMVTIPVVFMSLVRDFFCIPTYVDEYNNMARGEFPDISKTPKFGPSRFLAQLLFGWFFGYVGSNLKIQDYFGAEFPMVDLALGMIGMVYGISLVADCGDQEAPFHMVAAGALAGLAWTHFAAEEKVDTSTGFQMNAFIPTLAAQWTRQYKTRRMGSEPRGFIPSLTWHSIKSGFLLTVVGFALLTSLSIEVNGEQQPLRETIKNALKSEGMQHFLSMCQKLFNDWQEKGYEQAFEDFAREFKEVFDVDGENNSYKVLGLKEGATIAEVKKAHRKLALQNHPDKGGDAAKFTEIQEAYETLQKVLRAKEKYKAGG